MLNTNPEVLAGAVRESGPAWANVMARAPASLSFKGRTYSKRSITTPEQALWYLAAHATLSPHTVASLSPDGPHGLDADPSTVIAAQQALSRAKAAVKQVQAQVDNEKRQVARWAKEEDKADLTKHPGDVGSFLTAGIANGIGVLNARANKASAEGKLAELQAKLIEAQGAMEAAQADYDGAKAALDAQNATIRQQEEAARQQAAQDAAAAQAEAAARADAAYLASQQNAPAYSSGYSDGYAPPGYYGNQVPPDWQEDEAFQSELAAMNLYDAGDMMGDPDFAEAVAWDGAKSAPFVSDSPYSAARYYEGTGGAMFDLDRGELGADDFAFAPVMVGGSTANQTGNPNAGLLVTQGIIAGVLAAAPSVLASFNPPPASEASTNAKVQAMEKQVLQVTGVQSILDQQSANVGKNARPDFTVPALIVGAAILAAVAK